MMFVITPGAERVLDEQSMPVIAVILRHMSGDWGDLDAHDHSVNANAVKHRGRILSSYQEYNESDPVWVITDAGWETTTVLLRSEY